MMISAPPSGHDAFLTHIADLTRVIRAFLPWVGAPSAAAAAVRSDAEDALIAGFVPAGARVLDASLTSFVFELTGATEEIERFIKTMTAVGLTEVSRTGIAAMSRGPDSM